MKIAVIADIHLDINRDYPLLDLLIVQCEQLKVDVLIIAGDISNDYQLTINALDQLSDKLHAAVYFVPGNHDLWSSPHHSDSTAIYRAYCADARCLSGKTVHLTGDWYLCGDIAWFDYSFGDRQFAHRQFDAMTYQGRLWQDARYNHWCRDNVARSDMFIESLRNRLDALHNKKVILVTHMVSHRFFSVPTSRANWRYFNAFLGSEKLTALTQRSQVTYALMGHVHYRKQLRQNGTIYQCACLNYYSQWRSADIAQEIDEALALIEID